MTATAIEFAGGRRASAARVRRTDDLGPALRELGIVARPVLVVVGGAGGMTAEEEARVEPVFAEALVPAAARRGAAVVDGGTDVGVMRMIGRARASRGAMFPLVGVTVAALAGRDGTAAARDEPAALEPHHTHFVLVPGSHWGDEGVWLARVATALAAGAPSATVLVNGGDISWKDVERSLACGRPVLAVAGSGRAADELAAAVRGESAGRQASRVAGSGLVRAVDAGAPEAVEAVVGELLSPR